MLNLESDSDSSCAPKKTQTVPPVPVSQSNAREAARPVRKGSSFSSLSEEGEVAIAQKAQSKLMEHVRKLQEYTPNEAVGR